MELVTFDGDVTLYDDGACLTPENPVIPYLLRLLRKGIYVGIVTAAGYTDPGLYYNRLYGLLEAVSSASDLSSQQKSNLVVLGGECNFFFRYNPDADAKPLLKSVQRNDWALDEMKRWTEKDIKELLDVAQKSLHECVQNMQLQAVVVRKERAVGIAPKETCRLEREQLEETVLVVQRALEISEVGKRIPFCAFNGGFLSFLLFANPCLVPQHLYDVPCDDMVTVGYLKINADGCVL